MYLPRLISYPVVCKRCNNSSKLDTWGISASTAILSLDFNSYPPCPLDIRRSASPCFRSARQQINRFRGIAYHLYFGYCNRCAYWNVLVMIYEIYGAKNDVIVDTPLVNMRRQNVFVLTLLYCVCKLTPDFVGFLIFHFSRRKRLYQMMRKIITFFHSLRQGKSELEISCPERDLGFKSLTLRQRA